NDAASQFAIVVDTNVPKPTITGPASPTSSDPLTVTIDFGESVSGFVIGDVTVGGGTASNLVDNGNGSFTATIDAAADGVVTVDVGASVAVDEASNSSNAASQFSTVVDSMAPAPTITGPAGPTNSDPFIVTIDFGEPVSGFVIGDVTVEGGTASNLVDNGNGSFTASIDATADGLLTVDVASNVVIDDAGNSNIAATQFSVVVDTSVPATTVTGPASPTSSDPFTVTIDFGEVVKGFVIGDVTVGGGTASNLVYKGNGRYTATIDATTDGTVTIDIAANVATDSASNPNTSAVQYSTIIDTTAPKPMISGPSTPTNADPFNVTIDFGETVLGFTAGDIAVSGGSVTNLTDNANGSFTATIDASADGTVTVNVAADVADDAAGNANLAAAEYSVRLDTEALVPIIMGLASPTNQSSFDLDIDFGETVNGFALTDVTVAGGTASNLVVGGNGLFTMTISAASDGLLTVDIAAGIAFDTAGNPNFAATQYAVTVDTATPTPTITGPGIPTSSDPFSVSIDFGESVSGFEIGDITVGGGTASNLIDNGNGNFAATINASADGAVTVGVATNVAVDDAGNPNVAATQFSVAVDTTAPAPTITGPASPTSNDPFTVSIDFGETVSGFVIGDVTVGGGNASNLVDNGNGKYTATIDATTDRVVTVNVAANVAADIAGNPNGAATQFSIVVDTNVPTPTITGPASPTSSDPFSVIIDFGETVNGFMIGDVTVGGGTASNLVDNGNGSFTATIDAITDGVVTVDVGANVA
ncbi:beta strand repeat-containing protein, partial [Novipirellula herctigrandis]|uniref:beta strand repeat-containing protein n=1 Tax=Novipirellula herctigrandis TaxID=2527986 RepID=UPI003AF34755